MSKTATKTEIKTETRVQRPRLHKVILFNDDYTPRDFVVEVLKAVFRLNETQALNVMITAHRKGVCVVAVFAQDIAETKAARATEAGAAKGYPLRFRDGARGIARASSAGRVSARRTRPRRRAARRALPDGSRRRGGGEHRRAKVDLISQDFEPHNPADFSAILLEHEKLILPDAPVPG